MRNLRKTFVLSFVLTLGLVLASQSAAAEKQAAKPAAKPLDTAGSVVHGFRLDRAEDVPELTARARIFEHVKSGAKLLYLSTSDDNKVFSIAFRTPPANDTGVAHITEHAVLCGSDRFPTKEPFVDLLKGSLQTFLNAFTANDRTMYPVASRNDKDFLNLMNVYLDAVFHPRLRTVPEILMQEGWHYEVDPKTGELSYNGIVYNEMKGALSSPQRLLEQEILGSLFPQGTYGRNSGGDPAAIPDLTQEQFVAFHKRFYHPANSLIILYGNGDVEKHLAFLDQEYLDRFTRQEMDAKVVRQPAFHSPREVVGEYSINRDDAPQDKTFLSLSYVLRGGRDNSSYFGMGMLSYILVDSEAAPLRRALIDAGIGKDVESQLDNSILQPYLTIMVKNSNPDAKAKFLAVVEKTLKELVEKGIDKRLIEAAINRQEFALRESQYSRFPKGLVMGMRVMDSWTYGANPLMYLKYEAPLKHIKEAARKGYFEDLIRKHFLENPFRAVVILKPKPGLDRENAEKLRAKLAKIRAGMSAAELDRVKQAQVKLKARQEAPDSPAALATIPALKLSDLKREAEAFPLKEHKIAGTTVLSHSLPTNKIAYVGLYFDARSVPPELTPYLPLLATVLGRVGTAKHDYQALSSEVDIQTGGIGFSLSAIADARTPGEFHPKFVVGSKATLQKLPNLLGLISEILLTSKVDDKDRLKEIIQETRIGAEQGILEHGQSVAAVRAAGSVSPIYAYRDATYGLAYYRFLSELDKDFDKRADEIGKKLRMVAAAVVNRGGMLISVTLPETDFHDSEGLWEKFLRGLPNEVRKVSPYPFTPKDAAEAIIIPSRVQYVAKAADYRKAGVEYSGRMEVLGHVLGRSYLWDRVRVLNGAYGSDISLDRNGVLFMWSFRDPHLKKTIEAFDESAKFLAELKMPTAAMTKAIIATSGELDPPLTPQEKGSAAARNYVAHLTQADRQRERDEVLATTVTELKAFSALMKKAMAQKHVCALGSEEKVEEDRGLFKTVIRLAIP